MNNKSSGLIAFVLIIFAIWLNFHFDQPDYQPDSTIPDSQFSTQRAFEHVTEIGKTQHFVGSKAHSEVRNYIVNRLQEMGLEVQTQEGFNLSKDAFLVRPENILARIEGSGDGKNALVLMSHYDSATHSSYGASDDGSGVATILEGIRALLDSKTPFKNDIIILFTDAEELGLNGAGLFIEDHPWAEDAKLALNFEARGSGGKPFVLLETNGKNAKLIEAFKEADPEFPNTNSLAYSIYKMLPNDTDLTVLREQGDINGYNFAFIDDHFDYHTANDVPENLDKESLAHQGSYLMPLLDYFKDADLDNLSSDRDLIYFNLPFGILITYSFEWIMPMLFMAIILFTGLIIFGFRKERFDLLDIFKGFLPLLLSLVISGLASWAFWKFCLFIYPEYSEMEQGFTYNGYWYITASIFIALSICFFIYHAFRKKTRKAASFIGPVLLWLLLSGIIAVYVKGASYFIIPVYFGLLQLFIMIIQKRPNRILMAVLCFPAIFILMPFIWNLPVALGLKMLFVTSILTSLLFVLILPVFGYFKRLKSFGIVSFLILNILIFTAHYYSDFNSERPKPNSLVYVKDLDENSAFWYSYDHMKDEWTSKIFGENPKLNSTTESTFSSKYKSGFTFKKEAPVIDLAAPGIILKETGKDSSGFKSYSLKIAPNREVNRMELYELNDIDFKKFRVNNLEAPEVFLGPNAFHMFKRRWKERLLTYFATNRDTLRIEFSIKEGEKPKFVLYESAYDLFKNQELKVEKRPEGMIPRPFVLNDVTVQKKTIELD